MLVVREYGEDHHGRSRRGNGGTGSATDAPCRAEYFVEPPPTAAAVVGREAEEETSALGAAATRRPLMRRKKSSFFSGFDGGRAPLGELVRRYVVEAPRRVFVDLFLPLGYPDSVGDSCTLILPRCGAIICSY
mmetsp:Transcript_13599/g.39686  ORF Transcript_13599/g.39686 Transcript_13599/m.39686 type:complete len:133 (+) Transcript_13599:38-436(+)